MSFVAPAPPPPNGSTDTDPFILDLLSDDADDAALPPLDLMRSAVFFATPPASPPPASAPVDAPAPADPSDADSPWPAPPGADDPAPTTIPPLDLSAPAEAEQEQEQEAVNAAAAATAAAAAAVAAAPTPIVVDIKTGEEVKPEVRLLATQPAPLQRAAPADAEEAGGGSALANTGLAPQVPLFAAAAAADAGFGDEPAAGPAPGYGCTVASAVQAVAACQRANARLRAELAALRRANARLADQASANAPPLPPVALQAPPPPSPCALSLPLPLSPPPSPSSSRQKRRRPNSPAAPSTMPNTPRADTPPTTPGSTALDEGTSMTGVQNRTVLAVDETVPPPKPKPKPKPEPELMSDGAPTSALAFNRQPQPLVPLPLPLPTDARDVAMMSDAGGNVISAATALEPRPPGDLPLTRPDLLALHASTPGNDSWRQRLASLPPSRQRDIIDRVCNTPPAQDCAAALAVHLAVDAMQSGAIEADRAAEVLARVLSRCPTAATARAVSESLHAVAKRARRPRPLLPTLRMCIRRILSVATATASLKSASSCASQQSSVVAATTAKAPDCRTKQVVVNIPASCRGAADMEVDNKNPADTVACATGGTSGDGCAGANLHEPAPSRREVSPLSSEDVAALRNRITDAVAQVDLAGLPAVQATISVEIAAFGCAAQVRQVVLHAVLRDAVGSRVRLALLVSAFWRLRDAAKCCTGRADAEAATEMERDMKAAAFSLLTDGRNAAAAAEACVLLAPDASARKAVGGALGVQGTLVANEVALNDEQLAKWAGGESLTQIVGTSSGAGT